MAVVVPAQQEQVVEVGGAAAYPVPDVMGLASSRWRLAAGCSAVPIPRDECLPLRGGGCAARAAHVEHFGGSDGEDPGQIGVAEQTLGGRTRDATTCMASARAAKWTSLPTPASCRSVTMLM